MPKVVKDGERRVTLNCLVKPKTKAYLAGRRGSQGASVDLAVELLESLDDSDREDAEVAQARAKRLDEAVFGDGGSTDYMGPTEVAQKKKLNEMLEPLRTKPPTKRMPVPSWQRGPRPKGDKTR